MPDLVTHLSSVLLPGAALVALLPEGHRLRGTVALCALGTVLPDLTSRLPGLVLEVIAPVLFRAPAWVGTSLGVFHMPVGMLCVGIWLTALFVPEHRRRAAAALATGMTLHLALDLLQDHHGFGYVLFWPFSGHMVELGCVGSEASVPWAPLWALLTLLAWAGVLWRQGSTAR